MVESSSELDEDIESKNDIDYRIKDQEVYSLHYLWIETQFKWDTECIIERQNDNKELPLGLSWVILTDHKCYLLVAYLLKYFCQTFEEAYNWVRGLFHIKNWSLFLVINRLMLRFKVLPGVLVHLHLKVILRYIWDSFTSFLVFNNLLIGLFQELASRKLNNLLIPHILTTLDLSDLLLDQYDPLKILIDFLFLIVLNQFLLWRLFIVFRIIEQVVTLLVLLIVLGVKLAGLGTYALIVIVFLLIFFAFFFALFAWPFNFVLFLIIFVQLFFLRIFSFGPW